MSRILIAVDDNEARAREQAKAVINLPDLAGTAEITLLHVFTDNPEGASASQVSGVRRAEEVLTDAGFDVSIEEASGNPSEEIIKLAEDLDVDIISVAGRKRSPAGKALLGSVSQEVLLDAERPVLFVTK